MDWRNLLTISLGAILVNNFILVQFLGCCPFLGVSKKMDTAVGMGFAVIFVMGLASALCYPVNLLLESLGMEFMQTVTFILVIAALVQFVEMFLQKTIPSLYQALGVYLPRVVLPQVGADVQAQVLIDDRLRGADHLGQADLLAGDPLPHQAQLAPLQFPIAPGEDLFQKLLPRHALAHSRPLYRLVILHTTYPSTSRK